MNYLYFKVVKKVIHTASKNPAKSSTRKTDEAGKSVRELCQWWPEIYIIEKNIYYYIRLLRNECKLLFNIYKRLKRLPNCYIISRIIYFDFGVAANSPLKATKTRLFKLHVFKFRQGLNSRVL